MVGVCATRIQFAYKEIEILEEELVKPNVQRKNHKGKRSALLNGKRSANQRKKSGKPTRVRWAFNIIRIKIQETSW